MKRIIVTIVKDNIIREFRFTGKYRRDLEKKNWHYYETKHGILHFRKENMVAVEEWTD